MLTMGCPDLLVTVDHQSLIPILGDRSLADIPNPRLYRLKEKCLRFQFQIQYLPGKNNVNLEQMVLIIFQNTNKKS